MSIGPDIKAVLQELTVPITIYKRDDTVVTGEYFDPESYFEQSTEFIREFCHSGTFQYDSQIVTGDIIYDARKYFLLVNAKPTYFENEIVDIEAFLYECNCIGRFVRAVTERDSTTKRKTTTWSNVLKTDVHALFVGGEPESVREDNKNFVFDGFNLYCPLISTVQIGDRWYPDVDNSSKYYQVMSINTTRLPNILVCHLTEDSRE